MMTWICSSAIMKSRQSCLGRGKRAMPEFVGRHQAPLWAPLEEAAPHELIPSPTDRHRSALAPEPGWGHSSGQVCPQTTLGAWLCCRRAINWAVPIPAILFSHKPGSYTHEVRWHGYNRTSAHKGIFCLGSDRGNSNKLGWKLRGFLTLEPHKSQCQEERCEPCLLILLCHGLRKSGGKHWEAGN